MNKILFSDGGQPFYLDDLKLLQSNPTEQMELLLRALGAGNNVFLLDSIHLDITETNATEGTTTFKIKQNWLVANGIIYEIPETILTVQSWDTPLYVGVKHVSADRRTFEDGQQHACREVSEAYLTIEKTDGSFDVSKLKTLFELMAPLMATKVPVREYKDVKVTFLNGYSGRIQYKAEVDFYRVRMTLTSKNFEWTEATGGVFYESTETPSWFNQSISEAFLTGGDTPARKQMAYISLKDSNATLSGDINLDVDINTPLACPIKTFFIIPK